MVIFFFFQKHGLFCQCFNSYFLGVISYSQTRAIAVYCSFMLEFLWVFLVEFFLGTPQLFTSLNVMGGFCLLFDVSLDISHGKFISG